MLFFSTCSPSLVAGTAVILIHSVFLLNLGEVWDAHPEMNREKEEKPVSVSACSDARWKENTSSPPCCKTKWETALLFKEAKQTLDINQETSDGPPRPYHHLATLSLDVMGYIFSRMGGIKRRGVLPDPCKPALPLHLLNIELPLK